MHQNVKKYKFQSLCAKHCTSHLLAHAKRVSSTAVSTTTHSLRCYSPPTTSRAAPPHASRACPGRHSPRTVKVRCICGSSNTSGKPLVKCLKCDFWSHTHCARLTQRTAKRAQFSCHICSAVPRGKKGKGSSQSNKMTISIPMHILPSPPTTRSLRSNAPSPLHNLPSASSTLPPPSSSPAALSHPSVASLPHPSASISCSSVASTVALPLSPSLPSPHVAPQPSQSPTEVDSADVSSQVSSQSFTPPLPPLTQPLPPTSALSVPPLHHQSQLPIPPACSLLPLYRPGSSTPPRIPIDFTASSRVHSTTLVYTHNSPIAHPCHVRTTNPPSLPHPPVAMNLNPSARPFLPHSISSVISRPPASSSQAFPPEAQVQPSQTLLSLLSQPVLPNSSSSIIAPTTPSMHPLPTPVWPLTPPVSSSFLNPASPGRATPPPACNSRSSSVQQVPPHSAPGARTLSSQTPQLAIPLGPSRYDITQLTSAITSAVISELHKKLQPLEVEVSCLTSLLNSHSLLLQQSSTLISSIPGTQQCPNTQVETSSHPSHYSSHHQEHRLQPATPHHQNHSQRVSNSLPFRIVWGTQRNCSSQVLLKAICALLPSSAWGKISVKRSVRQIGSRSQWWFTIMAPDETMNEIVSVWHILESRTSWSLIQSLSHRPHLPHPTQTHASSLHAVQHPAASSATPLCSEPSLTNLAPPITTASFPPQPSTLPLCPPTSTSIGGGFSPPVTPSSSPFLDLPLETPPPR